MVFKDWNYWSKIEREDWRWEESEDKEEDWEEREILEAKGSLMEDGERRKRKSNFCRPAVISKGILDKNTNLMGIWEISQMWGVTWELY